MQQRVFKQNWRKAGVRCGCEIELATGRKQTPEDAILYLRCVSAANGIREAIVTKLLCRSELPVLLALA